MGWVVAFVGQKGGTGKSTLARAFAVEENARIYALARLLGVGDRAADDERGP